MHFDLKNGLNIKNLYFALSERHDQIISILLQAIAALYSGIADLCSNGTWRVG